VLAIPPSSSPTESHRYNIERWPDLWVGKESVGRSWVSVRDLHAAGLSSIDRDSSSREVILHKHTPSLWHSYTAEVSAATDTWTVELAEGYPFGVRPATNYSGTFAFDLSI
jgi:hypothetical protein